MNSLNVHIQQKKRIRSFSADRNELRKLLEVFQERAFAAGIIEEQQLEKRPEQTEDHFNQAKRELKEGFELFITLSGADGRNLTGNISQIFDSPKFPKTGNGVRNQFHPGIYKKTDTLNSWTTKSL